MIDSLAELVRLALATAEQEARHRCAVQSRGRKYESSKPLTDCTPVKPRLTPTAPFLKTITAEATLSEDLPPLRNEHH